MSPQASRRRRIEALSIVERGWRGARECSLWLNERAIPVLHLIKGSLSAQVQAMIQPYPHIHLCSVPRLIFRVWMWGAICRETLAGRLRWVLIDHERTFRELAWWCRIFRVTLVLIRETDAGHRLEVAGTPREPAAVFR